MLIFFFFLTIYLMLLFKHTILEIFIFSENKFEFLVEHYKIMRKQARVLIRQDENHESQFATKIIIIRSLIARRGSVSPLQSQP